MTLLVNVSDYSTAQFLMLYAKIRFLTKLLQFSENTSHKLFAKNITGKLATGHKYLRNE